jgi:hypothetical protein
MQNCSPYKYHLKINFFIFKNKFIEKKYIRIIFIDESQWYFKKSNTYKITKKKTSIEKRLNNKKK